MQDPTSSLIECDVATQVHGRYLVRPHDSVSLLVGFHGYGESAESQLTRLTAIPGSNDWLLISIQGLHRFYDRRNDAVVASWMTRQDRERAIADNVAYVSRVLDQAVSARAAVQSLVFAGFSQGVAMAFRAAAAVRAARRHVIAVGGDVPPELTEAALGRLSSVLVCRGVEDPWYRAETFERDVQRLRDAGTAVQAISVPGGHEWSAEVINAAETYLKAQFVGKTLD